MLEYIDFKIEFANRNSRPNGLTLDRVLTRSYDTAIKFRLELVGYELDNTYSVKLLSRYRTSGLQELYELGDNLEIVEGKLIYTPKLDLINKHDYVQNNLYITQDGFSLDIGQFNYEVDVSEFNNVI